MFRCMIERCETVSHTSNEYIDHLKHHHEIPRDFRFHCTFQRCPQIASTWHTFRRHLLTHEKHLEILEQPREQLHSGVPKEEITVGQVPIEETLCRFNCPSNDHAPIPQHSNASFEKNLLDIESQSVSLTLYLHSKTNLTRENVHDIQKNISVLNSKTVSNIKNLPLKIVDPQVEYELNTYLDRLENGFDFIDTDYKFFKHLEDKNLFKMPTMVQIDHEPVPIGISIEDVQIENDKSYVVLSAVEFQIRKFLQTDNIIKDVIKNTLELQKSQLIQNIVNGQVWQDIRAKYKSEHIIPISLYCDEFEINDCLSSHNKKHAICGVYYSFPTLPEKYASKLCNIFIAAMIKKIDINECGINMLFRPIVQLFTDIENKLFEFDIDNEPISVRFVVAIFQGDNLGIHMLYSFMYFTANYYCRFCKRPRYILQTDSKEHSSDLRTIENYNLDLATNNPTETGIRGNSILNSLPSFHVTKNLTVDPMHDVFCGGIGSFGLEEIINYCIFKKRYVTLNVFNAHKIQFSKQVHNSSLRRMPDITETFSSTKKCKSVVIRSTASEMKAFLHFFPLIMGPFVPENDEVWHYCLTLLKLVDRILQPSLSATDLNEMDRLCEIHHKEYQRLFKEKLKPKHHFVSHYSTVAKQSGPPAKMMNFRFEAKHKVFKEYARVTNSRRNIALTLCIKSSLQFSYDLVNKAFFKSQIDYTFQLVDISARPYFHMLALPIPFSENCRLKGSDKIHFINREYKSGMFLTITEIETIYLYEVVEFLVNDDNLIHVVCVEWEVGCHSEHYLAYEAISKTDMYRIRKIEDFDGPPISLHMINSRLYFRKSYDFLTMDL